MATWKTLPLGAQSFSLKMMSAPDVVRTVEKLGLKNIEFFHGHISPDSPATDVSRLKTSLGGLSVGAYGLYTFSKDPKHNQKAFDFAKALGARNITANAAPETFDGLGRLAERYQIRVALHNSGPGTRYEKLDTLVNDLKGQHELIGACVDTGHVLRSKQNPANWIETLGSRVFVVHLTDVAETAPQTHSAVLGKGHLNLPDILGALNTIKFPSHGSISIGYQTESCTRLMTPGLPFDPVVALGDSLRQLGL